MGAAIATPGTSRLIATASLSDSQRLLRASITIRLEPRLWICSTTTARAPEPIATTIITAATPMTMPSIVSKLRRTLPRIATKALRSESK
jgi:hypothetical protein